MFPTSTTENIPFITFCMGKEIQVIFGDFSCVNRFENYGNKPLGFLINTFGNTIWTKPEIEYNNSIDMMLFTLIFQ